MARPREFDEHRVMLAVRDAFWDKGYAGTSMDDLLRASGLGKGSLYGAFGDKRSLFLRVLREYDDANLRALRERLAASARAIDFVREFALGPAGDPSGAVARRGCLLANSNAELATSTPEVAAEARRSYGLIAATLTEALERARREGDLAPRRRSRRDRPRGPRGATRPHSPRAHRHGRRRARRDGRFRPGAAPARPAAVATAPPAAPRRHHGPPTAPRPGRRPRSSVPRCPVRP
ncbi:transcriptional regulator, TetR family [Streptomyces sp. SolWspMP-sol7th]|uniref:TetR/AcrR family transcriptional regulator n=1 Tax=Streptomyces sp. SolWspMP-sol7th TaxID=1839776 RepID=UPI00081D609B|nr:TetR/AcrR family transcriptional regulator [Streptomyces sp. SolWspMP-sol7th]SCD67250.1 transcriptional regulator, TetR family [Streptomyces sp. SolWspMP-sol7th]